MVVDIQQQSSDDHTRGESQGCPFEPSINRSVKVLATEAVREFVKMSLADERLRRT